MSVTFLTDKDLEPLEARVEELEENGGAGSGGGGKDGVSCTHEWDGTVLTVTSASGTSSADLKGEKGDTGAQGPQGEKGDTGAQGPQGEKGDTGAPGAAGNDGHTPVKGVDYFTDADKAEMVAAVIESLGGNPVFGVVDDNNNIIVSGNLSNGTYTVKYEMEDGSTVDIGQLVVAEDEPAQTYTNLANPSDANWKEGKRLNSSYAEVDAPGMVTTNFIPAVKGNKIYVKGLSFGSTSNERVCQYLDDTANNAIVSTVNTDLYSVSGDVTTITLDGSAVMANSTHVRICGTLTGTSADVVITVNEEID